VNIDFAGARSDGSVDGSGVKQEIETFLAARSKDEKWLLVDVFRGFQRRASSERFLTASSPSSSEEARGWRALFGGGNKWLVRNVES
jgi:hypothetical protein